MKHVRSDAGCAIVGTKLCVIGGFDGHNQLRSAEAYDFNTQKWSSLPKMTTKRSGVSCAAMNDKVLYVLGGYNGAYRLASYEMYSFRTKQWTLLGHLDTGRSNFSCCVYEGKVLVCGGFDGAGTTNHAEIVPFDEEERGKKPTKMAVKRSALAVCLVKGDDLDKGVLASFQSPNRAMKQPPKCGNCGGIHDTDDDMTSEAEDSSLDDTDMAFWGSPDD